MQFTENKNNYSILNDGYIFVIVIFFSIFFRLSDLDNRPFHTDEAVHAVKFGELLETGNYTYDPIEYHGPTLNYFTTISSIFTNKVTFSETTEFIYRVIPAITSLLLLIMFLFLRNEIGDRKLFLILFIVGFSPSFVFYSRYYIQESMLVTFSFSMILSVYKYYLSKNLKWVIVSGVLAGLIFATKETSIIFFASFVCSLLVLHLSKRINLRNFSTIYHLFYFVATFIIISVLFYSSFFTNPQGIIDSVSTFFNYFNKAGSNTEHVYPWYYYFEFILFTNNKLILFTQIPLFIFSVLGIYFSFTKKSHLFFSIISIISIFQAIVYSLIPYKTPWLILNFWIGFLILAGFGISEIFRKIKSSNFRIVFSFIIGIIFSFHLYQTILTSFTYPYQPENPFTYSQPTPDIISASQKVENVLDSIPNKDEIFINVIAKNNDYWPLPWYLRKFPNIAWNNSIPNSIYKYQLIISSPEFEEELINKLYSLPPSGEKNLYVPLFDNYVSLRPGVELRGYIQKDFYDFYLRSKN